MHARGRSLFRRLGRSRGGRHTPATQHPAQAHGTSARTLAVAMAGSRRPSARSSSESGYATGVANGDDEPTRLPADTAPTVAPGAWHFFVSYAPVDEAWAEWIAWQLERDQHRVLLQAWDGVPGSHWMNQMNTAIHQSDHTIAVVSRAYIESVFEQEAWQAVFRRDPEGLARRLIPVCVEDCSRPGLLGSIIPVDLSAKPTVMDARKTLLEGIRNATAGRAKPTAEPTYPGLLGEADVSSPIPSSREIAASVFPGKFSGLRPVPRHIETDDRKRDPVDVLVAHLRARHATGDWAVVVALGAMLADRRPDLADPDGLVSDANAAHQEGRLPFLSMGEHALVRVRPHWASELPTLCLLPFLLSVAIALLAVRTGGWLGWVEWGLAFLTVTAMTVLARAVVRRAVARFCEQIVITNLRIVCVSGITDQSVIGATLEQITDMTYTRSLLGHIFDFGTFVLEWKSTDGTVLTQIPHIPHPDLFYIILLDTTFGSLPSA
ncbi:hypothetical protein FraEuI1c_5679 [Pseudofrankia inefficax]|uniref:TIR domain-containing protein n=1 Tax=Pseudofrankia inefficax (strain DSM 45817 / CECT 9037 / DDB 130130 / EuI1c) TaxID=298654 RepID=E3IUH8_PSEI1|nr:hypothetical protein FraEuI1c_5679 [Pseudofrankia inefficax]